MRPNEDPMELAAWNAWLSQKYPDRAALAAAWNVPARRRRRNHFAPLRIGVRTSRHVRWHKFSPRVRLCSVCSGEICRLGAWHARSHPRQRDPRSPSPLARTKAASWIASHPCFLAVCGLHDQSHLVAGRSSALGFAGSKTAGLPMLIQETGVQRQLNLDETSRLTPEQEASLFERKIALSFVQGSGAIEWLWNTNSYMTEGKRSAHWRVACRRHGKARSHRPSQLRKICRRRFALPQESQAARRRRRHLASRAIFRSRQPATRSAAKRRPRPRLRLHQPCYVIAESQIEKLGSPKLVILPSAQALRESTWQALLAYVRNGGNLLVTGPVSRDEHWHLVDRLTPLGIKGPPPNP